MVKHQHPGLTNNNTSARLFAEAVRSRRLAPQPVIELANALVLRKPNLEILQSDIIDRYPPLAHLILDALRTSDRRGELLLSNLVDFTNSIAIFSDYGGDAGRYRSFSFLITDYHVAVGPFAEQMKDLRLRHGLLTKEISYKDLHFGPVKRCMQEFTNLADRLPGLLFTVLISKDAGNIFGDGSFASNEILGQAREHLGLQNMKPKVFERLLTIVHSMSLLVALLSRDNQKIFWMTDNDAICVDHNKTLQAFVSVLGLYTNERRFDLIGGALPFVNDKLPMLDNLSVADLAAGISSHLVTQLDLVGMQNAKIKDGADHLLMWLARQGIGMKKMTVVVRKNEKGFYAGVLQMAPKALPENALVTPIFMPARND